MALSKVFESAESLEGAWAKLNSTRAGGKVF